MEKIIHLMKPVPAEGRVITNTEANQVREYHTSVRPHAGGNWTVRPNQDPKKVDLVWRVADGTGATWEYTRGEFEVPNLDAMPIDELRSFFKTHEKGRNHLRLFEGGGKGTVKATADLAAYAMNKGTAMVCREQGKIEQAKRYEDICDRIFKDLPEAARW